MKTIRKSRKWLLAMLMVVPVMAYAAVPQWTEETIEDVYEDIRDYSEHRQTLVIEEQKLVAIEEDLELVKHRMGRKESVLDQVESGQLSLTVAGEIFHELDRENVAAYPMEYRPGSLVESAQARVIKFLKIRHHGTPEASPITAMIRRLEAEFEARFGYPAPQD